MDIFLYNNYSFFSTKFWSDLASIKSEAKMSNITYFLKLKYDYETIVKCVAEIGLLMIEEKHLQYINVFADDGDVNYFRSTLIDFTNNLQNQEVPALFNIFQIWSEDEIFKILIFIDSQIAHEKNNLLRFSSDKAAPLEFPDYDYSGSNELSIKEKLIICDNLGITGLLRDQLADGNNATHLAQIIGSFTSIPNKKGTLTGYCNYLIRPDNSEKNSPYYSDNTVNRAMQVYNTFRLKAKADKDK